MRNLMYVVILAILLGLLFREPVPSHPGFVHPAVVDDIGGYQTRVRQFPDKIILRRGNFVIRATVDGYLCYGTRTPLTASCHKAMPEVLYAGE
jgi:hypothetical protein